MVGELRRKHSPEKAAQLLGVSRGFLYYHFGWTMDKVGYIFRKYGKALGEIVQEYAGDNG
ncbi:MAG: hypothetical protein PWQ91_409 [Eubacteriales bacterium]|nr:hypothetical protein [Eubacteriales bacterium]MDN5363348.1 hypothetical protein [Eubacteriales bacterium]